MNPLALLAGGMLFLVAFGFIDIGSGGVDFEHAGAAFDRAGQWASRLSIMVAMSALVLAVLLALRRGWLTWDMITGSKQKKEVLPGDLLRREDAVIHKNDQESRAGAYRPDNGGQ